MAIPTQRPAMLDHIEAAFHRLSQEPGCLTVDGRTLGSDVPQRVIPLAELRPLLLRSSTSFDTRDRAIAEVARRARSQPDPWALGLTWLLLPGLRDMATRLTHAGADPEEADAEMFAGVLSALGHPAIGDDHVASSICWHAYRHCRRQLFLDEPGALSLEAMLEPLQALAPSVSANPEEVLAVAVRFGVILAADAELIATCRLEGRELVELAAETGLRVPTVQRRRARAEARVVALLDETGWGVAPMRGQLGKRWRHAVRTRGTGRYEGLSHRSRPDRRHGASHTSVRSPGLWSSPSDCRALARTAA